jgi:hypothetical protein
MSDYVTIENGWKGKPLAAGTWDETCAAMDGAILEYLAVGWTVTENVGTGFRVPGGRRRTYLLPPDGDLHRIIEVTSKGE